MKKEEVLILEFMNDAGKFCSSGEALVSVKGNVGLSDVSRNYPERVGSLKNVIGVIDSIHGLPAGFPSCSIEIWSEMGGAKGSYVQSEHLIKLAEDAGKFQSSTFAHEFGHHITLGEQGSTKSDFYGLMTTDLELKIWHNAVKSTHQFRHFHKIEVSLHAPKDVQDYAFYLKDPRDLFARSYSQWIATKSGNKTLLDQHAVLRTMADGMYQWSDSEFVPIGQALDAYFSKRGWLK